MSTPLPSPLPASPYEIARHILDTDGAVYLRTFAESCMARELLRVAPIVEAQQNALDLISAWESGWRMEEADYLEAHPSNAGLSHHLIKFSVPRAEQFQEALAAVRAARSAQL